MSRRGRSSKYNKGARLGCAGTSVENETTGVGSRTHGVMFQSKPKFDANKCKVQLKMLINRLNLLSQKKGNLAKADKRKVAELLRDTKEHNARILVEQIIRDDYFLEAYDLIKQYTEMLIARFNVITLEAELKPEVAASVCALVYAGYLMGTEIDELKHLHILFTLKYGKQFTQDVIENKEKYINHRLLKILTQTECPDATVVDAYLEAIAQSYGVEYVPQTTAVQPISATLGIALPTPGQPMPGATVPEPMPDLSGGEDPPSKPTPPAPTPPPAEPGLMMGTEVPVVPMAHPMITPGMTIVEAEVPVVPMAHPMAHPVAHPMAHPVAHPVPVPVAAGSGTGAESLPSAAPFRVMLSKVCDAHKLADGACHLVSGFGLTVDAQDVVTAIAPPDTAGVDVGGLAAVVIGDKIVAINGRPVTGDAPIKSLAADIDLGTRVPVDLVRFTAGSVGGGSMGGGGGVGGSGSGSGSGSGGGGSGGGGGISTTAAVQPTVVGGPVPPVPPVAPALAPTASVGPPPTAPPPVPPPPSSATTPAAEESMEDILKKRLDALKMA